MRKSNILLLFLVFGICRVTAQNNVDVQYSIPPEVDAGSEFLINVFIEKGSLSGIARFQMNVPNGFEVIQKKSANGEFRFQDQTLIIQWLKLPVENKITLSFSVKVNPALQGYFVLNGGFHYIEGSEKKMKEFYPHIMTVKPVEQNNDLIIQDNEMLDISGVVKNEISCIRQKPSIDENNEIIVNLLVTKGNVNKFGKIQEQIPLGYKAENIASKSGIFVFNQKSRIVKYMWMNLPDDSQFKVSYKLVSEGVPSDDAFIIIGKFIYAENNTTKEVEIVERNIEF